MIMKLLLTLQNYLLCPHSSFLKWIEIELEILIGYDWVAEWLRKENQAKELERTWLVLPLSFKKSVSTKNNTKNWPLIYRWIKSNFWQICFKYIIHIYHESYSKPPRTPSHLFPFRKPKLLLSVWHFAFNYSPAWGIPPYVLLLGMVIATSGLKWTYVNRVEAGINHYP